MFTGIPKPRWGIIFGLRTPTCLIGIQTYFFGLYFARLNFGLAINNLSSTLLRGGIPYTLIPSMSFPTAFPFSQKHPRIKLSLHSKFILTTLDFSNSCCDGDPYSWASYFPHLNDSRPENDIVEIIYFDFQMHFSKIWGVTPFFKTWTHSFKQLGLGRCRILFSYEVAEMPL